MLPQVWPLPLSLATTRGISVDFFSSPYLDVSVQAVPFIGLCIQPMIHGLYPCVFPHSEICGSKDMCSSPQLIAAYRVLRRLLMPRHSPCALFSLTFRSLFSFSAQIIWQPPVELRISFDITLIQRKTLIKKVFLFVAFLILALYSVFNVLDGGDKRNRTAGLLRARQALSHLSYIPR